MREEEGVEKVVGEGMREREREEAREILCGGWGGKLDK